jgi:hypothetical protein
VPRPAPRARALKRLLVVLALAVLPPGAAGAALPPPPFALDVAPLRVSAGQPVRLVIAPRGDEGLFDLYLMWALSPEAAFLTPQGTWSPQPVAFRAGARAIGEPIVGRWLPGPGRDIPLALVVVPAGGDPLARFAWTYRPAFVRITVDTTADRPPLDLGEIAPLAAVTLVACAIVLLAGKPFFG